MVEQTLCYGWQHVIVGLLTLAKRYSTTKVLLLAQVRTFGGFGGQWWPNTRQQHTVIELIFSKISVILFMQKYIT